MNSKVILIGAIVLLIGGGFFAKTRLMGKSTVTPTPTPTATAVEQLPTDKQPLVSLLFSGDAHYVTVNITNINAALLEYNLIYDATVKNNQINTGVSASSKTNGNTTYTNKQLLGSESSGRFTYHTAIRNATMELTLRNDSGYSVFTATYPFTVSAGKSIDLKPSE